MANETREILADAFRRARDAAIAADPRDDGGTCNFDTPAFKLKGARQALIEAAAADAGVRVSQFHWFGGKWYWLHVPMNGQANRRSTMMEAAQAVLNTVELRDAHACGYYQMD